VCISRAPQSPSSELETTRSLKNLAKEQSATAIAAVILQALIALIKLNLSDLIGPYAKSANVELK